jgi:NAD-dependent dihydropyrimidine dehydrogenase PreA subunit
MPRGRQQGGGRGRRAGRAGSGGQGSGRRGIPRRYGFRNPPVPSPAPPESGLSIGGSGTGVADKTSTEEKLRAGVDPERCIGCGMCQRVCRYGAVQMIDNKAVIGPDCTGCGICVGECPEEAISLVPVVE